MKLDFKLDSEARLKEVAALSTFRSPSRLRPVARFHRRGPNFDGVDSGRQENNGISNGKTSMEWIPVDRRTVDSGPQENDGEDDPILKVLVFFSQRKEKKRRAVSSLHDIRG